MSNELLDPAGVEAKFGVPPRLIVDYLALIGDSVGPGVAKCGPKTALKWLAQYGDLDASSPSCPFFMQCFLRRKILAFHY